MKKVLTFIAAILLMASVFAQTPEKMSYQAVIRNSSNALVTNTQIGIQISILQGSVSGTEVYVETQTPTTNVNGLFSIEIGDGTVQKGTFSTINWANGQYFIKTETDPTGGANYTITGTSQLLSVPYALHAKTAGSIEGGINETDPVFGASAASRITGTDTTNWNNKQDELTAGTGINITNNVISTTSNATSSTINYKVGDFAQGGIVFWVDETGQHGLVAAKEDQSKGVRWHAGTFGKTQAKGDGLFAGKTNTSIIIAALVAIGDDGATYAARICNELQITEGSKTYGDWYLPSKEELNLMYQNKAIINNTATANDGSTFVSSSGYYWSSTEANEMASLGFGDAWEQHFSSGLQIKGGKTNIDGVRAVRAF